MLSSGRNPRYVSNEFSMPTLNFKMSQKVLDSHQFLTESGSAELEIFTPEEKIEKSASQTKISFNVNH